jgi:hypothetical protein
MYTILYHHSPLRNHNIPSYAQVKDHSTKNETTKEYHQKYIPKYRQNNGAMLTLHAHPNRLHKEGSPLQSTT